MSSPSASAPSLVTYGGSLNTYRAQGTSIYLYGKATPANHRLVRLGSADTEPNGKEIRKEKEMERDGKGGG